MINADLKVCIRGARVWFLFIVIDIYWQTIHGYGFKYDCETTLFAIF